MSDGARDDPLNEGLGRTIRSVRTRAGMSMRTMAARCGVSQPFISEIERGQSMPSIVTLYRIAAALDVSPASLLPTTGPGDVHVVRADEGRRVRSSERPGSASGRLIFSDDTLGLEVFEYVARRSDDLDVWFVHPGHKVLHVVDGRLTIEFDERPAEHLGPGDCIVHPGTVPHRWTVSGDGATRLFLVVSRPPQGERRQ